MPAQNADWFAARISEPSSSVSPYVRARLSGIPAGANPQRPLPEWAHQWLARNLGNTPGEGADRIFALLANAASPLP